MDDAHFQRALVLFEQSRLDLAEPEVRQALVADPDNALAHAMLSICLLEREDWNGATDEARTAVRLGPDSPFSHATLARVLANRQYLDEALESAEESLRLDPTDADTYALLSLIHTQRRDWTAALNMAEQGLEHDAEHVGCNNARAMALTKLGRTAEAGKTLAAALEREPENSWSHANLGWTSLHEGNSKKALEHFREALRLDPTEEYAKAGLVEALKARNPIYGLMLKYFLFMGRLSSRAQWALVIGAYFINRILSGFAKTNPKWAPWITPLLVAYIIFVVLSFLAQPFFNLLLRLNRYGRHALSDDQRRGANLVGILGLLALISLLVWLFGGAVAGLGELGTIYFGLLLLPASSIHKCDAGWPRWCMAAYTIVIACMIPIGTALFFVAPQRAFFLVQIHIIGCALSWLVTNVLIMQRAKRHSATALG
jgi:Tfp pilus assembly protein PilF